MILVLISTDALIFTCAFLLGMDHARRRAMRGCAGQHGGEGSVATGDCPLIAQVGGGVTGRERMAARHRPGTH